MASTLKNIFAKEPKKGMEKMALSIERMEKLWEKSGEKTIYSESFHKADLMYTNLRNMAIEFGYESNEEILKLERRYDRLHSILPTQACCFEPEEKLFRQRAYYKAERLDLIKKVIDESLDVPEELKIKWSAD